MDNKETYPRNQIPISQNEKKVFTVLAPKIFLLTKRIIPYLFLFLFLLILHPYILNTKYSGNASEYVILEISTALISLIIGILTLIRFYARKNNTFLFIGAGLIGTSIINSYHLIATSSFFHSLFPMLSISISYWSWEASGLFLSSVLFLSVNWRIQNQTQTDRNFLNEKHIPSFILLFLIFNLFIFSMIPFNFPFFQKIPHIQQIIPEFLFILTLLGYLKKGLWKSDYFDYFFIFFLVINVVLYSFYMPSSSGMFDAIFMATYVLELASLFFIFVGFTLSTFFLFKDVEVTRGLLTSQNLSLKQTRFELEESLKNSILKEAELNSKITDLENTKKALFNVLDDLNVEKAKVEEANVKDEAILESIGEGMIVTDPIGKAIIINKQAEIALEINAKNILGQKWSDYIKMTDQKGNVIPLEKRPTELTLATGKKVTESSFYYLRADGSKFPVVITSSPVILDKKLIGSIMVFRDITREKEIDRMKTEFISLASHQLRTPLSAIKWFSEMLANGDAGQLNKDQADFTQNICQSTEKMIELVNSLLNISRIESGRIIVDSKPTDLGELVIETVNEVRNKLDQKHQKLNVNIDEKLPKINLDPNLIRQVYINLLTNSIKYTPEGGEISVDIALKDDQVISRIKDNGYGIPEKDINRVFHRFFRGENIVKVEIEGTGLGLYLAKAIIDSSKGKIWFESQEGRGTCFYFSLPLTGIPSQKGDVTLDT